jgi:hypothetical protein
MWMSKSELFFFVSLMLFLPWLFSLFVPLGTYTNPSSLIVKMVGLIGLEPMTPALSRRCSNQLSYRPIWSKMVEVTGFEPMTFCLQSRRSTN